MLMILRRPSFDSWLKMDSFLNETISDWSVGEWIKAIVLFDNPFDGFLLFSHFFASIGFIFCILFLKPSSFIHPVEFAYFIKRKTSGAL